MTPNTRASAPERTRVEIILSNGFVATELAAVLDVLRFANRLLGNPLFTSRIATYAREARLVALGGLAIAAEAVSPNDPKPVVLVVAGGGRDPTRNPSEGPPPAHPEFG